MAFWPFALRSAPADLVYRRGQRSPGPPSHTPRWSPFSSRDKHLLSTHTDCTALLSCKSYILLSVTPLNCVCVLWVTITLTHRAAETHNAHYALFDTPCEFSRSESVHRMNDDWSQLTNSEHNDRRSQSHSSNCLWVVCVFVVFCVHLKKCMKKCTYWPQRQYVTQQFL